jgi:O-methyltransferase
MSGEERRPPDRAPRAVAATAGVEELRAAYLELLKLCLCDLAGTATTSVWTHTDGSLLSRELAGDELEIRVSGADWPLHGVSMAGLRRLDDLQACVEAIVRDGVEGDLIEAGTWRGGASILMRATLDALGAEDRTVWVADSFQGFPADDEQFAPIDYLAVPVEDVRANFARLGYERGLRFVAGFFEDTLPGLAGERWSLLRLDGDTYEATWTTLQALYPGLSAGGYVVVDDYGALEECRRAVDEFRAQHGIDDPIEEVDWTCVHWRRSSEAATVPAVPRAPRTAPARAVERPPRDSHVVSVHERNLMREKRLLQQEVEHLRERLRAAEREVAALRRHPLRGPRALARRVRGLV